MRKMLVALILIVTVCLCCRYSQNTSYADSVLPARYFDVPVNKDTTITTAKGLKIEIPNGALKAAGSRARIVVREAFTLADMVRGKLATRTGNDALCSGGMFYVGAGDKDVKLLKPITVWLPTLKQVPGMKLYKGDVAANGTIDWVDPTPLPEQELSEYLKEGQVLFRNNCASCHSTTRKSTGSALAFLDQRRDWHWLEHWVWNSAAMIGGGDRLSVYIYDVYNKTAMTAFPSITTKQLHQIFDYANYEARDIDPNTIPDYKKQMDSCDLYCELAGKNKQQVDSLVDIYSHYFAKEEASNWATNNAATVIVETQRQLYYQTNIEAFGWHNVDILSKNLPGFESSSLVVSAPLPGNTSLEVWLLLPGKKIYLNGYMKNDEPNNFIFYENDEQIPLPQNERAIVFATGVKDGKDYFGVGEFITSRNNKYALKMVPTTLDSIAHWMAGLDTMGINMTVRETSIAQQLRQLNGSAAKLKQVRPQNCNCKEYDALQKQKADTAYERLY